MARIDADETKKSGAQKVKIETTMSDEAMSERFKIIRVSPV